MEHKLGLIGCGVVGQGLLQILHDKKDYLRDAFGFEARVVAIADKLKGTLIVPEGIDIPAVLALLGAGKGLAEYPKATPAQVEALDPLDMIERTDADIIAEMTYTDIKTGEPASSYIKKALRTGKSVVTSNKGPAALHYREIQELARQNGLHFRIEGTVMSGTPVFHLAESGLAGNTVREVKGILNGTTNFILTKMETEGMDYGPALALAQKLGYAEADPTADVEGFDALAKVVILSNVLLGGSLKTTDVPCKGISVHHQGRRRGGQGPGLPLQAHRPRQERERRHHRVRLPAEAAPVRSPGRGHGRPERPQPRDRPDGQDHHPGRRGGQARNGLRDPVGYPGRSSLLRLGTRTEGTCPPYRSERRGYSEASLTDAASSLYARAAVTTVSCRLP